MWSDGGGNRHLNCAPELRMDSLYYFGFGVIPAATVGVASVVGLNWAIQDPSLATEIVGWRLFGVYNFFMYPFDCLTLRSELVKHVVVRHRLGTTGFFCFFARIKRSIFHFFITAAARGAARRS